VREETALSGCFNLDGPSPNIEVDFPITNWVFHPAPQHFSFYSPTFFKVPKLTLPFLFEKTLLWCL